MEHHMEKMKKDTKFTFLLIAALMLLWTGCGNNDAHMGDASEEIEGQTVSYGPITITLPKEYAVKEKYPDHPVYYATDLDSAEAEYKPNIRFSTDSGTVTSNADVNKENFIAHQEELISIMEDSEFKEVVSYEETEINGYKVIKVRTKEVIYGRSLVVERCNIYEKVGSSGVVIGIKYDGLESDVEHLDAFEACLDSLNLKTEMSERDSVWQRIFYFKSGSDGSPLHVYGNYAEYGPIQMQMPDGYTAEDDAPGSFVFSNSDGASFSVRLTKGSYQLMSDQTYAEKLLKEELESTGITDVNVIHYEAIRISGYDGYEVFIQANRDGQSLIEYMYVIFETSDEDMAPTFRVTHTASEEVARNMTEDVDAVFNSIRLVNEWDE